MKVNTAAIIAVATLGLLGSREVVDAAEPVSASESSEMPSSDTGPRVPWFAEGEGAIAEAPVILVYSDYASEPGVEDGASVQGTHNLRQFEAWKGLYVDDPHLTGAISIKRCKIAPIDPEGPPPDCGHTGVAYGGVTVTALIYDEDTLQFWADTGFVPGFMNEVEVAEIPLTEAVFDMDYVIREIDGTTTRAKLRVRKSDGAIALVSVETTEPTSQGPGGAIAGPGGRSGNWWPPCCWTQLASCNALHNIPFIGWFLCNDCSSCFNKCLCESVSNPCHSCGGCGLSWLLCHLPGGHCG